MSDDIFAPEQGLGPQQKTLLRATVEEVLTLDLELADLKRQEQRARDERKAKINTAVQLLTDAGTKTVRFEDGLTVTRRTLKFPSVAAEFWPKFKLWLQRNKYWGLAKIHAKTLQSLLKERLERGQKIPDYVKVFEEDSLTISGKGQALAGMAGKEEEGGQDQGGVQS